MTRKMTCSICNAFGHTRKSCLQADDAAKLDDETKLRIEHMRAVENMRIYDIAFDVGLPASIVAGHIKRAGLSSPMRKIPMKRQIMTPTQFYNIRDAREAGECTTPEVAKAVGVPLFEANIAWTCSSYEIYRDRK